MCCWTVQTLCAQVREETVRVVVLGAQTPLGQEVVDDLLFRGHQPTAVLEDAPATGSAPQHPVSVAVGDITDPAWLDSTVAEAGAVIDVLAAARGQAAAGRARTATTHLVGAMSAHQVDRYVGFAPQHLYPAAGDTPRFARVQWAVRRTLHPAGIAYTQDRFRMITASQLNWTIVRAPTLTAGPARGIRHVHLRQSAGPRAPVTRIDTARFLAAQVLETSLWWTSPVISN
nr:NAD(P)H-binding protein [Kocuria salina]